MPLREVCSFSMERGDRLVTGARSLEVCLRSRHSTKLCAASIVPAPCQDLVGSDLRRDRMWLRRATTEQASTSRSLLGARSQETLRQASTTRREAQATRSEAQASRRKAQTTRREADAHPYAFTSAFVDSPTTLGSLQRSSGPAHVPHPQESPLTKRDKTLRPPDEKHRSCREGRPRFLYRGNNAWIFSNKAQRPTCSVLRARHSKLMKSKESP